MLRLAALLAIGVAPLLVTLARADAPAQREVVRREQAPANDAKIHVLPAADGTSAPQEAVVGAEGDASRAIPAAEPPAAPAANEAGKPTASDAPASATPYAAESAVRLRMQQLLARERALKQQARPPGFRAQLITAAALGGVGLWTAGAAFYTSLVMLWCDCGNMSRQTFAGLLGGGYGLAGAAGLWALTVTTLAKRRTDREQIMELRRERRGLKLEYQRLRQAYREIPVMVSLSPRLYGIGVRGTF